MPFKYHPYFNFYRQHHNKKTEDDAEEADAEKEEVIPFQPYHPYFHPGRYNYQSPYHFDPYFYYNYHHGKKPEGAEGEEKDKVEYPESDFYPFYMAKPTEEEIKEYEEKMKEYEEEMKKQEAEFKERQDKMKAEYEQHQEKMKAGFFKARFYLAKGGNVGILKICLVSLPQSFHYNYFAHDLP